MSFYYLLYFLIPLIYTFSLLLKKYADQFFLLVTYVMLVMVSSFRDVSVGTDTHVYSAISKQLQLFQGTLMSAKKIYNLEYMYLILNRVVDKVFNNPSLIVAITSIITITLFFYSIRKSSRDYLLSVIVFVGFGYYFLSFNIARQFLAVSIALVAISLFEKGRNIPSLILIIFAGFFHSGAFTWLSVVIFVLLFRLNKRRLLIVLGSIPFLGLGIKFVIPRIIKNNLRYQHYVNAESFNMNGILATVFFIVLFTLVLFLYMYKLDLSNLSREDNVNIYVLLICIAIRLFSIFIPALARVEYVFEPYLIIVIPYVIRKRFFPKDILAICAFFFLLGILLISVLLPGSSFYGIIPYKTIF